jgi:hypothetical protein
LENSDVVKPTNAVSATKNTLKGSTKNKRSSTSNGPLEITRTVSATAERNVARQTITLTVDAWSR